MMCARWNRIGDKYDKLVVCTASDKTAMESMVSAQHGLLTASEMLRLANISILKVWSIFFSKAPKVSKYIVYNLIKSIQRNLNTNTIKLIRHDPQDLCFHVMCITFCTYKCFKSSTLNCVGA